MFVRGANVALKMAFFLFFSFFLAFFASTRVENCACAAVHSIVRILFLIASGLSSLPLVPPRPPPHSNPTPGVQSNFRPTSSLAFIRFNLANWRYGWTLCVLANGEIREVWGRVCRLFYHAWRCFILVPSVATVLLGSSVFLHFIDRQTDEISLLSEREDFIIDLALSLSSVSLRTHLTLAKRDETHLLRLPGPINPSIHYPIFLFNPETRFINSWL